MKKNFTQKDLLKIRSAYNVARERNRWTVAHMAEALQITQPALSGYMNGRTPLNMTFVLSLAELIGVQPYDLVDGLNLQFKEATCAKTCI